ncbi:MAG: arginase family protein [Candidatus Sericytochromatia bacterium]
MSSSINRSVPQRRPATRETIRAIVANAQPGGRFPGVELPPNWFQAPVERLTVGSVLPEAGDREGIVEAVHRMSADIRDAGLDAFRKGLHPILVGGCHALAMGSMAAATTHQGRTAVIWVDAHADFNTPDTSPSGNPHGMPLAVACGLGDERLTRLFSHALNPSDLIIIGARAIDPLEKKLLEQQGVWHVSVPQLREMGIPAMVSAIAERFAELPVHLSFDFDSISAEYFIATGTPVANGLTPDEAEALLQGLAASDLAIKSSDWVEFDPSHDKAEECGALSRRMFEAMYGRM